jgi:hypothetical protein
MTKFSKVSPVHLVSDTANAFAELTLMHLLN